MGIVKESDIKNKTYYFFNDMIDIRNFQSNLLEIDKKHYKIKTLIFTILVTLRLKKIDDYENIRSVSPFYLIIHSGTGYFKEKNDEKYLIVDLTEKYEEVFSGIRSETKMINSGEELYYGEDYVKIGVNTDDNVPLNKKLKFPSLTIIIRYLFQNDKKLYPQVYLDECLYEL